MKGNVSLIILPKILNNTWVERAQNRIEAQRSHLCNNRKELDKWAIMKSHRLSSNEQPEYAQN